MNSLKPQSPIEYLPGIPIKPRLDALAWLDDNNITLGDYRRYFKIPVTIRFENEYRLHIFQAVIGVHSSNFDNQVIYLSLDDSAMGISLIDHLRHNCEVSNQTCAVWLEGYWGKLIEDLSQEIAEPTTLSLEQKKFPFAVRRFGGLISESDNPAIIYVEKLPTPD